MRLRLFAAYVCFPVVFDGRRQHDAAAAVLASMAAQPESPGTDGAGAAKIDVDELAIAALRAAVAGSTANVNEVVGALYCGILFAQ